MVECVWYTMERDEEKKRRDCEFDVQCSVVQSRAEHCSVHPTHSLSLILDIKVEYEEKIKRKKK